jgi:hypothetical protein
LSHNAAPVCVLPKPQPPLLPVPIGSLLRVVHACRSANTNNALVVTSRLMVSPHVIPQRMYAPYSRSVSECQLAYSPTVARIIFALSARHPHCTCDPLFTPFTNTLTLQRRLPAVSTHLGLSTGQVHCLQSSAVGRQIFCKWANSIL